MDNNETNMVESYRLSTRQRHLWLQERESASENAFRVQTAIAIEGALNIGGLRDALRSTVQRHEILRTAFEVHAGMDFPVQTVRESGDGEFVEHDLSELDPDSRKDASECIFNELTQSTLDIGGGTVLLASLIRYSDLEHLLILSLPAMCGDLQSIVNLTKELSAFYNSQSGEPNAAEEPFQYVDFSEWTNELFSGDDLGEEIEYWKKLEFNEDLALYSEAQPNSKSRFTSCVSTATIEAHTADGVRRLSEHLGVSLPTFLLASWQILLCQLSGQYSQTVGLYCDGRKFEEMDGAIGLFGTYVPLRIEINGEYAFKELLEAVQSYSTAAQDRQEFWRYSDHFSGPDRFFSFGFDFHRLPSEFRVGEVKFKPARIYSSLDRFKLRLSCVETEDSIITQLYFDPAYYDSGSIESIIESFRQLLESGVKHPNSQIDSLEILSTNQESRLIEDLNRTDLDYRRDVFAHQLFEEMAVSNPNKVAVVCNEKEITYGELNSRAEALADRLRTRGLGPEVLCAICVERSIDMAVGIIAVLKAGGGYVPLDPNYPHDRLAFILQDSQPKLLLTDDKLLQDLPDGNFDVVLFDSDTFVDDGPSTEDRKTLSPDDPAYVIYTSGSTGAPKGVVITHGNLGHYAQSLPASLGLKRSDRYLHTASISFSSSVRQLILPLALGATAVIATAEQVKDPFALLEFIWLQAVTILDLVPSYWRNFVYALENTPDKERTTLVGSAVRMVLSASEPLSYDVALALSAKLDPAVEQINMFGQTETTGIVSLFMIDRAAAKSGVVPAGRPIGNAKIYLLDPSLRPVVYGAPGEIYIGGPNVGREYLNDGDLSTEKFIKNPFSKDDTDRLYRTGDLGRYSRDGQIEFLGRNDSQVKIRGHRIEPGEVEAALRQQAGVRDAVVVTTDDSTDGQKLIGYVVPEMANAAHIEGRERYRLPNNMSIVQQNRHETDFFYQQIFVDQTNFKHGIRLRDGDVVVDVGANIGFFTMFVQQVWKDIKAYAYEPIPAIFKTLSINTSLYGGNTKLFQCGLAEEIKDVVFTYYPNSSTQSGRYGDEQEERAVLRSIIGNQRSDDGHSPTEEYFDRLVEERIHGEKIKCSIKTLSEVIRENNIDRIDLLKIDAEKSEFDVLKGIEKSDWAKIQQLVIEAHDINGQLSQLVNMLEKNGFLVVAEEDSYIEGSGLYNVYARRPSGDPQAIPVGEDGPYPIPMMPDEILSSSRLRKALKVTLPEYMIPSNFVLLESLPLTPNGKLDRAALLNASKSASAEAKVDEPGDELEVRLVKIWERLLEIHPVGVRDNFFDLGGHSLLAVRLFSQIEKTFGKNLPLATLFECPTIGQLADKLRQTGWTPNWSSLVTIQPAGNKTPFFCIHALGGNVLEYHPLSNYLGSDQPFYGLQSLGLDESQTPHKTIEEMASHYIREMQTIQPDGPYMIGGRSLGGTVAFEMACQLRASGYEVALVALLDTDPMGYHKLLPLSENRFSKAAHMVKRVKGHVANLKKLTVKQRVSYFRGKLRYVPGKIKNKLWKVAYNFFTSTNLPLPKVLQSVGEFNFMAVMNFVPKIYPGNVKLFWANEDLRGTYDVQAGWNFLAKGGVDIINIPGNHLDIVKDPYVQVLAEKLKNQIDGAQARQNADSISTVAALPDVTHSESNADIDKWINHEPIASH